MVSCFICLSMMLLLVLRTNRGLEKVCDNVIRSGLNDASVILDDSWTSSGPTQQRRVLPVHPDPGVRETRIAAATTGGSEDSNCRRCGDLGGMLCVDNIECMIDGT